MVEAVLVVVAGGVGAVARHVLDAALSRNRGSFPTGIFVVNVMGSLALGVVVGLGAASRLPEVWVVVLGVGFCGAFTTFSTAAVDAARLLAARRWAILCAQWVGMFVACTSAGLLGYLLGAL